MSGRSVTLHDHASHLNQGRSASLGCLLVYAEDGAGHERCRRPDAPATTEYQRRPRGEAPGGNLQRSDLFGVARRQRGCGRAVPEALAAQRSPGRAVAMVHDDRRFVAHRPPRRDGSPDEVHVLTEQQVVVETVKRIERLPAEQQRCGRDISHPPAWGRQCSGGHPCPAASSAARSGPARRRARPGLAPGARRRPRTGRRSVPAGAPTNPGSPRRRRRGRPQSGCQPPASLVACRSGPSGDLALNDPGVRAAGQLRDRRGVAGAVLGHHHTGGRRRVRLERCQQRGQTLRVVAHGHDAGHVACPGTAGRRHGMGQPGLAESPPEAPRGAARRRRARAQARE